MAHVVVNDDVIAGTSICSQGNYKHLSVHLIFLKTLETNKKEHLIIDMLRINRHY